MPLKNNLLLISTLFFLGFTTVLYAEECGVLRYLASKSNGVEITGNKCKTIDDIAVGSAFNLTPGARLWFKSSIDIDAKKTQGICQNRSSKPIRITVDSSKQPWIKPSGLSKCSAWADNKMTCEDGSGAPNALSCVIATVDAESHPKGLEERTTSVRMRSIPSLGDPDKNEPSQSSEAEKERIIAAMQADADLCRSLNHGAAPVKITWLVEANARVNTVTPDAIPSDADKPFVDCISAVIKDFSYPQLSQAIWLSNQF